MANSILVLGNSGKGKTSALMGNEDLGIKGLDPKETFLINVTNKPLPLRGWKSLYTLHDLKTNPNGNMIYTHNYATIINYLKNIPTKMPHIKNVVVDDSNYLITQEFMNKVNEKGYDKFNSIASNYFNLINVGISMPDHINFIVIGHTEIVEGEYQLKTVGKMISEKITPQGYFTYCLVCSTKTEFNGETKYGFFTNATRDEQGVVVPAKTPAGIFKDITIPNDLGYVIQEIENYNNGE